MTTRIKPVTVALFILAAALVFHALVPRYRVTHLSGLSIMRTDRWTGDVRLCHGGTYDFEFTCGGKAYWIGQ